MRVIKVKTISETLDYISKHTASVARFGDGEIDIIAGILFLTRFMILNLLSD